MELSERLHGCSENLLLVYDVIIVKWEVGLPREDCIPESKRMNGYNVVIANRGTDIHNIPDALVKESNVDTRFIGFPDAECIFYFVPPLVVFIISKSGCLVDVHVDLANGSGIL